MSCAHNHCDLLALDCRWSCGGSDHFTGGAKKMTLALHRRRGLGQTYQEGDCCDATPPCTGLTCPMIMELGIWRNGQCAPLRGAGLVPSLSCNKPAPKPCTGGLVWNTDISQCDCPPGTVWNAPSGPCVTVLQATTKPYSGPPGVQIPISLLPGSTPGVITSPTLVAQTTTTTSYVPWIIGGVAVLLVILLVVRR